MHPDADEALKREKETLAAAATPDVHVLL